MAVLDKQIKAAIEYEKLAHSLEVTHIDVTLPKKKFVICNLFRNCHAAFVDIKLENSTKTFPSSQ